MYEDESEPFDMIVEFINRIKQQVLNPTVLPYLNDQTKKIRHMVKQQKQNLKTYKKDDHEEEVSKKEKNFKCVIYAAEIQKIQYLLKMYLKTRLKKIQLYCFYFLKNQPQAEALLSEPEMGFMRKYADLRYQYYKDNIFKNMLKNYRDFKGIEIILAKSEEQTRQKRILIQTKQSQIQLIESDMNQFVFMEISRNAEALRYGIDIKPSNVSSESSDVIPHGAIVYGPFGLLSQKMNHKNQNYRLI